MTRIAVRRSRPNLQRCVLMAVLLAGMAALAGGSAPPKEPPPHEMPAWRRTRDGWEQPHWLTPLHPARVMPFHPFLAAVLVVLVAAIALVGYEPRSCVHISPPSPHFHTPATRSSLTVRPRHHEADGTDAIDVRRPAENNLPVPQRWLGQ